MKKAFIYFIIWLSITAMFFGLSTVLFPYEWMVNLFCSLGISTGLSLGIVIIKSLVSLIDTLLNTQHKDKAR